MTISRSQDSLKKNYQHQHRSRALASILTILFFIPPTIVFLLVTHYGVNIPAIDQWDTPYKQIVDYYQHHLSLASLTIQHNESRKLFPNLIFIGLTYLTNSWDNKIEMIFTILFNTIASLLLLFLLHKTNPNRIKQNLLLAIAANFLIFSLSSYYRWLSGISVHRYIPIFTIICSLSIFYLKLNKSIETFCITALAFISQFSFSGGIIAWFINFLILLNLNDRKFVKTKALPFYLISFIGGCFWYFYDYHKPETHPSLTQVFSKPVEAFIYFFSFLGNPFSDRLIYSTTIGIILVTLYLTLISRFLITDRNNHKKVLPWICIGLYSILESAISTIGRLGFGLNYSLDERYLMHSNYLTIAILIMSVIALNEASNKLLYKQFVAFLFTFVISISFLYNLTFIPKYPYLYFYKTYGKTCLEFIDYFQQRDCLTNLYPNPDILPERAKTLNSLNLLKPGLIKTLKISNSHGNNGHIETLTFNSDGTLTATGWAVLEKFKRAADAVVLTARSPDRELTPFAIAKTGDRREDVRQVMGSRYLYSGWQIDVAIPEFCQDLENCKIEAYAFDASNSQTLYKLIQN